MELTAERITRQYHRQGRGSNVFTAVQETSLALVPGRLVEVEGRSGSGKSTLLNMMAGILAPTGGKVMLDGQDLYALPDDSLSRLRNRAIGMVPQGQTGLKALTVLENVLLPAMLYGGAEEPEKLKEGDGSGKKTEKPGFGREKEETRPENPAGGKNLQDRALALLDAVGIAHLRDAYPDELSGGEGRRMAIARALIMDPGVVLADEPTADLDDGNTRAVLSLLRRCADQGLAVLLVTHEREAAAYADEAWRMNEGLLTPSR